MIMLRLLSESEAKWQHEDCAKGRKNTQHEEGNESEKKRRRREREIVITGWKGKLFSRLIETNNIEFTQFNTSGLWGWQRGSWDYYRIFNGNFEMWTKVRWRGVGKWLKLFEVKDNSMGNGRVLRKFFFYYLTTYQSLLSIHGKSADLVS